MPITQNFLPTTSSGPSTDPSIINVHVGLPDPAVEQSSTETFDPQNTELFTELSPQEYRASKPNQHYGILQVRKEDIPPNKQCACIKREGSKGCYTGTHYLAVYNNNHPFPMDALKRQYSKVAPDTKEWQDARVWLYDHLDQLLETWLDRMYFLGDA
jgi:hypothetical protein